MALTNCKINLILTWSASCIITNSRGTGTFAITNVKPHAPVVTFSTKGNAKLLQELKSGFKRTITRININLKRQRRHKTDI